MGLPTDRDHTVPITSWTWTQLAGPTVSLNAHPTGFATFRAPQVDADTKLTFRITVVDENGRSSSHEFDWVVRNLGSGDVPLAFMPYVDAQRASLAAP